MKIVVLSGGFCTERHVGLVSGSGVCRALREKGILEGLPEKLKQAALAREQNPSASLTELAAMMEPPITKPAMNNRMKKLAALAKETVQ